MPKLLNHRWRARPAGTGKQAMLLLLVYLVLVVAGIVLAYFFGLAIERTFPVASLPTFLTMYFLILWASWVIAVRVTEPKPQAR
jgi:hypothetical protein